MVGWTLVMPALKRVIPLPTLARLLWVNRGAAAPRRARQQPIVRVARRLLRARSRRGDENCLERSLVLYRFLSMASLDPRLVLGVRRDGDGVTGHAWITVDGDPVVEASVADYAPIASIGPAGLVEPAAAQSADALASFGVRS
jgi:hypothetical protein